MIIEDSTIVFEYSNSAANYKESTGINNGLIVTFYEGYSPYSLQHIYMDSGTDNLFLIDTIGRVHELVFNLIEKDDSQNSSALN